MGVLGGVVVIGLCRSMASFIFWPAEMRVRLYDSNFGLRILSMKGSG
jgi:hypothetical protein